MKGTIIKNIAFITGSAGFIGFHLSNLLLANKWTVIGLDAITNYYDIKLKHDRHNILKKNKNFVGYEGFIQDNKLLDKIFFSHKPNFIVHLAAQAGVRYSIENPLSYVESNLLGTFHILEIAKKYKPEHFLVASTSSVYGNNEVLPFSENHKSDNPMSFYAATKKSNEVMAHSYSHLFKIPTTVFRFFTVYGPWSRPDMALIKFTKNILNKKPIEIYNNGNMRRDFTYIDDLVQCIKLLINVKPLNPENRISEIENDSISKTAPFRIVNIGNSNSINLLDYVKVLEESLGVIAEKKYLGVQNGEVLETYSDVKLLKNLIGICPNTSIEKGVMEFVKWFRSYYD